MNRLRELPKLSTSQKLMVFTSSMILFGLSSLIAKLLPSLDFGPFTLSAEYLAFIPLIMCIVFHPFYAAFGAAAGQLVVNGLIISQVSGIDGLEKFFSLFLALFIAGILVKDPENRKQTAVAAMSFAVIYFGLGSLADLLHVIGGAGELAVLPGLAQIIIVIEIFSFFNAVLVSGILFGMLPVLYLMPYLNSQLRFWHRRSIVLKARRIRSFG